MVDDIAVHGGAEVAQLTDIWHLTGVVVLSHVTCQALAALMVLLTDAAQQDVCVVHVHLGTGRVSSSLCISRIAVGSLGG